MTYSMMNMVDSINMSSCMVSLMHNFTLCLVFSILLVVMYMFFMVFKTKLFINFYNNSTTELFWTIMPMLILFSMGVPSFILLYCLELKQNFDLTYKSISHQWYWSYENKDMIDLSFDSYMLQKINFSMNRLLEVDNNLILPFSSQIQMIVTSEDVLHSWALPNLSMKIDAVPGRLNSISLSSIFPSKFYGQCSEICGINHSFMPISVEFCSWKDYFKGLF